MTRQWARSARRCGGVATAAPVLALVALAQATPARAQEGSPAGAVPAARLSARRAALLAAARGGTIVVRSAEPRRDNDHAQDSFFRQDDDFFYLTGLEESGAVLVGVAGAGTVAPTAGAVAPTAGAGTAAAAPGGGSWVLYLPERIPAREQWSGARLGPGPEASRLTGIADIRPVRLIATEAPQLLAGAGSDSVPILMGGAVPQGCTARGDACSDRLLAPLLAATQRPVSALAPYTAQLRLVKDEDERARLRRAGTITADAVREAMATAAPGQREYELETVIEAGFHRRGAERVGFPSIVGSGPNSTVLHYDTNRRELRAGDLVVMDVGAEFGYYTADVTRTIPVSGTFTARQRAVYDLVLGAQQAVIDSIRPGRSLPYLERIAREHMRTHSGTLCGRYTCDNYFIHGVSHWLGLDVHDVGAPMALLVPGIVLTVEPGVYLPDEGLGVRIEDDVLVTAAGHEVLTVGAPRTAADVERAMRAGRAPRSARR